jgi:hypothetical protein
MSAARARSHSRQPWDTHTTPLHLVQDARGVAARQRVAHRAGSPHAGREVATNAASRRVDERSEQTHAPQRFCQVQLQPPQREVANARVRVVCGSSSRKGAQVVWEASEAGCDAGEPAA